MKEFQGIELNKEYTFSDLKYLTPGPHSPSFLWKYIISLEQGVIVLYRGKLKARSTTPNNKYSWQLWHQYNIHDGTRLLLMHNFFKNNKLKLYKKEK